MEVRIEHFVNALKMWISTSEQDHNWVLGGGADWTSQAWRQTNFRPPVTEMQQDYDCEFIPMPWQQNEAEQLKIVSKVWQVVPKQKLI